MSACQVCHEREASVHLTQVRDDQVVTMHLCGRCAAEHGVTTADSLGEVTPLGSFLSALGPGSGEGTGSGQAMACPGCGATLSDIRASGRLGCGECWSMFDEPLRDLVRRLHGSTRHTGAWYDDPAGGAGATEVRTAHERTRLRDALREAVETEAFETAAAIRDQLRALDES
jgi:protein arginine kinase activator